MLHYQPVIDLTSGAIVGAEALLRWRHGGSTLRLPSDFVPAAEANGLIVPIGQWALKEACAQNRAWQARGLPDIRMTVNISARQLSQPDFAAKVAETMRAADLDPRFLEIELTETAVMADAAHSARILRELREMDIRSSVDDFGTGYSSLSYLKRFPIDAVKIDRSFVHEIISDTFDQAIAQAIITLAHSVGLRVTGEGVETLPQLELLRALECDEVQGFYFSSPVPASYFEQLLRSNSSLALAQR